MQLKLVKKIRQIDAMMMCFLDSQSQTKSFKIVCIIACITGSYRDGDLNSINLGLKYLLTLFFLHIYTFWFKFTYKIIVLFHSLNPFIYARHKTIQ